MARIVNKNHFNRISKWLNEKVALGGESDESELFIAPTILSGVKASDAIMADEIFGPILPIVNVSGVNEAIAYINANPKPLAMYIFSTKSHVQEEFLARTSAGGVVCNDTLVHLSVDTLPFGGVGNSGIGQYHGKFSFDTFVHKKAVMKKNYNRLLESVASLRYPPYSDKKSSKLSKLLARKTFWFPTQFFLFVSVFLLGALSSLLAVKFIG